jgi:hypothetical protein
MDTTRSVQVRRLGASLASLTLAVLWFFKLWPRTRFHSPEDVLFFSLIAVPPGAAALIWSRRLSAQLLARGAWWSFLLIGALMATATRYDASFGFLVVVCSAAALLVTGRTGLAESDRFQPAAFRGTLILALVLAMADTGALLVVGLGGALFENHMALILLVPMMIAGVIGLLRLRTWGLAVNLTSNLLVALLGSSDVLYLPGELRPLFVGSAIVQLLIPVPMLVTIARGRAPGPDRWGGAKVWLTRAVIVGIGGLSFYAAFVHTGRPLFGL